MDQVTERAVVDSLMDAVDGARRTRGGLKLEAFHQSRQPHSLPVALSSGTSVRSTGGVAASSPTRCRGTCIFLPCRCGDFGFVSRHKPAEHHVPMFLQLQTLRRHVSRPVAAGVSLSAVHIFSVFAAEIAEEHCQVVSPISKLTFKVALPPLCCRGNLHSFFMTLLTGREASSFQLPWGRGVGSVLSC